MVSLKRSLLISSQSSMTFILIPPHSSLAAAEFAERWKGRGYERGESQPFWIDLLSNVYGIETPSDGFITFEDHRMVDASNFIDGRIRSTKVLIEQKSLGKDLRAGIRQSDNSLLNPFQQARRYVVSLPVSEHPRWIVTCNFSEFLVYDMEQPIQPKNKRQRLSRQHKPFLMHVLFIPIHH